VYNIGLDDNWQGELYAGSLGKKADRDFDRLNSQPTPAW
jgi:hypothetical protein